MLKAPVTILVLAVEQLVGIVWAKFFDFMHQPEISIHVKKKRA